MSIFVFIIAILLMLSGHIWKIRRWSQFIAVYEKPYYTVLLNALAYGHSLNAILPIRIGDIVRIVLSGRKLKNGYTFAIATVITDLYLDLLTVGLFFFVFSLFKAGTEELYQLTKIYAIFFIIAIALTIIFFCFSKAVKTAVKAVCSIFNTNIEITILYIFWAIISSLKDIKRKLNISTLLLNTTLIWTSYLLSYVYFAKAVTLYGTDMSISNVFALLFSNKCASTIWSGIFNSPSLSSLTILLLIYMMLPLLIILLATWVIKIKSKSNINIQKLSSEYRRLLPQLNKNERLVFLEAYFSDERKDFLNNFLEVNRDIHIVQDMSSGSKATTLLCVDNNINFYRKYAFGVDGDKLGEQLLWIKKYQDLLPLTNIISEKRTERYCCYTMEYSRSAVGLFQYLHSVPQDEAWRLIERVFNDFEQSLYLVDRHNVDLETIQQYINNKVIKNLDRLKASKGIIRHLLSYDDLIINGVRFRNIGCLEKWLTMDHLSTIFKYDKCSAIHGDMTVENIICELNSGNTGYYIIDPNTGNILDSPFLDYSKFLQSLHGCYEFLIKTPYVNVNGNHIDFQNTQSQVYSGLFIRYRQFLNKRFSSSQVKSIFYHEIIHWLRLLPYRIEKDGLRAALFYAGFIRVFNDVIDWFED